MAHSREYPSGDEETKSTSESEEDRPVRFGSAPVRETLSTIRVFSPRVSPLFFHVSVSVLSFLESRSHEV
jgi:hypothetical protein